MANSLVYNLLLHLRFLVFPNQGLKGVLEKLYSKGLMDTAERKWC